MPTCPDARLTWCPIFLVPNVSGAQLSWSTIVSHFLRNSKHVVGPRRYYKSPRDSLYEGYDRGTACESCGILLILVTRST